MTYLIKCSRGMAENVVGGMAFYDPLKDNKKKRKRKYISRFAPLNYVDFYKKIQIKNYIIYDD